MRQVLACNYCRKRKSKCVHNGSSPCKSCKGSPREWECVLEYPGKIKASASANGAGSRNNNAGAVVGNDIAVTDVNDRANVFLNGTPGDSESSIQSRDVQSGPQSIESGPTNDSPPRSVPKIVPSTIPRSMSNTTPTSTSSNPPDTSLPIIFSYIKNAYPELLFLHLTLIENQSHDFLCVGHALQALYNYSTGEDPEFFYDKVVRETMGPGLLEKPNLSIVQALLILSLLDWDRERYYSSRIFSGMSINMVQELDLLSSSNPFLTEQMVRTFWCAVIVYKIVSVGATRTFPSLTIQSSPLPLRDDIYLYIHTTNRKFDYYPLSSFSNIQLDGGHYSSVLLIRVFEIWGKTINFLVEGGRKVYREPPWNSNSIYHLISRSLQTFRSQLPEFWTWDINRLSVHQFNGTESQYLMINAVSCLCSIFLTREYTPFFPHSNNMPVGPVEEPLLPSSPEGFWDHNSVVLFSNTRLLSQMILACGENGCKIQSPFWTYCVYTAAIQSSYGRWFSWMDPESEENNFEVINVQMTEALESQQRGSASNWVNINNMVSELYEAVSKNRHKAQELSLGRDSLKSLEDSIQVTSTKRPQSSRDLIAAINIDSQSGVGQASLGQVSGQDFLVTGIDSDDFLARVLRDMTEGIV